MRPFALIGVGLTLASCSLIGNEGAPLSTFEPAGPSAERIDGLFWLTFWIATVIFFLVMGALVVALFLFRLFHKIGFGLYTRFLENFFVGEDGNFSPYSNCDGIRWAAVYFMHIIIDIDE